MQKRQNIEKLDAFASQQVNRNSYAERGDPGLENAGTLWMWVIHFKGSWLHGE
jgi:hypothetical protein